MTGYPTSASHGGLGGATAPWFNNPNFPYYPILNPLSGGSWTGFSGQNTLPQPPQISSESFNSNQEMSGLEFTSDDHIGIYTIIHIVVYTNDGIFPSSTGSRWNRR